MVEAIKLIDTGSVHPLKQSHLIGRYYGKLKMNQCQIDINTNAQMAYNLVRGVSMPYYGAFFKDYKIWKAHVASEDATENLLNNFKQTGIYMNTLNGNFILFEDSALIIDKCEKINNNEGTDN